MVFVALAVEDLARGIDDSHLVLTGTLVGIRLGVVGIANGVDALVATRQSFQLVKHLVFVVEVVDQTEVEGLLGVEHGLQVVGNLVELFHADVAALADALEDWSPDCAQQFVHLLAIGLAHLV